MAELAYISLAGNLLQFAELGAKLVRGALERYKSVDGSTTHDEILIADARRLRYLAGVILNDESDATKTTESPILRSIAQRCTEDAAVLIEILDALKVDTTPGQNLYARKLQSFEQSLRPQKDIQSLFRRLEDQNNSLEAKTTAKLDDIVGRIDKTTQVLQKTIPNEFSAQIDILRAEIDDFNEEQQYVRTRHHILRSLKFDQIKARQEAIKERHRATFDWVFSHDDTLFPKWLESGNGIFWIRGKPGSGKSTLMKFLVTHPTTRVKLRVWGNGCTTTIASHYFWNAGSSMQKSQRGLLQTLLYEVLREVPNLIDRVCSRRRRSALQHELMESWAMEELLDAFALLANQTDLPVRFCFFIDGLDEYTDRAKRYDNTFEDLLRVLQDFASSPSIKVCVSSRPWDAFLDAFGAQPWQLRMEDLTRDDIRNYVTDILCNNDDFTALTKQDDRCSQVAETIVDRAQGVFLWIYLVVESLKNGLAKGDTFTELQNRVDELPADLEEYFQHMIESIEPIYWESTSRIFRIMIESGQALPLLAFEFLEQEAESASYALQMKVASTLPENVGMLHDRMKKRLNARGKDLLYVTFHPAKKPFLQYQVDFLHRTVRDFFIDRDVLEETKAKRKTSHFNPALSLCRIMLALVKTVSYAEIAVDYNEVLLLSDGLMYHARAIQEAYLNDSKIADTGSKCLSDDLDDTFNLLDALDHTNTLNSRDQSVHWTNFRDIPKGNFKEKRQKNFLASAIQARLSLYVKHKIDMDLDQVHNKTGRPLLDYALRPTTVTPLELPTQEGPVGAMVEFLLQNGADPNQRIDLYGGKTPWQLFLSVCYGHSLQAEKLNLDKEEVADTILAMLLSGANPKVRIGLNGGGKADVLGVAQRLELSRAKVERIRTVMKGTTDMAVAHFFSAYTASTEWNTRAEVGTDEQQLLSVAGALVIVESLRTKLMLAHANAYSQQFVAVNEGTPFTEGPPETTPAIYNRGPSTVTQPTLNSPQYPSHHLIPTALSTTSIAIQMASIIIRQDPGSIYRPGRTNIGYSIVSDDGIIGEPASQDNDDSWMEFLTDEAITDLTLPDQDLDMTPDDLSESDTQPQDAQPDLSEVVIDSIEAVIREDEAKEENQKDKASHAIATQEPLSPIFRGSYDNMGNPFFQRDYDYEPALPPHLRRPIFVDWAEPFKTPVYALRYLAEIAGDYYTVALMNKRINMQQRPQTPVAQIVLQSHLLSPAASHIATPARTPAAKRLRFSDDVVHSG
ncbi:hypothetical protein CSIM01_09978 [Colletotrichum simmondsii]|uniref:Uncharacterized protein n=1 Tax=Colletotrichum simmondsii TaxID=703756 RepID=A0A135RMM1_9PEZI|nr:hypothetical protein CSIM01_09978 [Colletotrichum simmondsii]